MSGPTRLTLIQRVSDKKDEQSWQEFVDIYRNYILSFITKMGIDYNEAEDVSQKVLLKLWDKMPEFEYRPGECRFRSWMVIICRSIIKDHRNLKQNKMRAKIDYDEAPETEVSAEVDTIALEEWKEFISKKAWENITPQFKPEIIEVFLLCSQKSIADIAEEKGIAENTVYSYRKRVSTALKKEIYNLNYELG